MNYLFVCAYAAPYKGNFICSLEALEKKLTKNGNEVIYAFIKRAKEQKWCKEIEKRTKVYFLPNSRFNIKTYFCIKEIYKLQKIDIVHSHFELYDIPVKIMANNKIKIVWHLHDAIDYKSEDIIHKMLNKIQYKFLSNNVKLISISEYYQKEIINLGMKKENTKLIFNGIDYERIIEKKDEYKIKYNFYTLGWDYYKKGIDIILEVLEQLYNEGNVFKICLNGNKNTWNYLNRRYGENDPNWLVRQEFVEDLNSTIEKVGCFIQASRMETFSYALGEMIWAGVDIVASDIEGTKWAKEIPIVSWFESENKQELYNLLKKNIAIQKENRKMFKKEYYSNARDIIKNNYSLERWVDEVIDVYEEIKA